MSFQKWFQRGWDKATWDKMDELNKITFQALDPLPMPDVIVDRDLPEGTMYMLNTKMLRLGAIPKFEWQAFKPGTAAGIAAEQDAKNETILQKALEDSQAKLQAMMADASGDALKRFLAATLPSAPAAASPKAKKPELPAPAPRRIRFEDEDNE